MMRQFAIPRRRAILPGVIVALFLLPSVVMAHAELVESTPTDGATLDASPTEIFATYSEAMDPSGSSLKLVDKDDKELATGGVDPDDAKRMSVDDVPDLAPGTYTVRSTTKSAEDGDIDRAEWSFTVDGGGDSGTDRDPDGHSHANRERQPRAERDCIGVAERTSLRIGERECDGRRVAGDDRRQRREQWRRCALADHRRSR